MSILKPQFTWSDRRPIAALYLSSRDRITPDNPAGWLAGKAGWGTYFEWCRPQMKKLNAQGMVIWDLEGSQYPQSQYAGSPDVALAMAPDIAPYADEFFAAYRREGYKVGLCLRPSELGFEYNHFASPDHYKTLLRKARYARQRWKCKLFYVDTNCYEAWGPTKLPANIFARLHKDLPDCLFMPELSRVDEHLWGAPYYELDMGFAGTTEVALEAIPQAFSVINVSDGDIPGHAEALRESFKVRGDIPLFTGWWPDPHNDALLSIL